MLKSRIGWALTALGLPASIYGLYQMLEVLTFWGQALAGSRSPAGQRDGIVVGFWCTTIGLALVGVGLSLALVEMKPLRRAAPPNPEK